MARRDSSDIPLQERRFMSCKLKQCFTSTHTPSSVMQSHHCSDISFSEDPQVANRKRLWSVILLIPNSSCSKELSIPDALLSVWLMEERQKRLSGSLEEGVGSNAGRRENESSLITLVNASLIDRRRLCRNISCTEGAAICLH